MPLRITTGLLLVVSFYTHQTQAQLLCLGGCDDGNPCTVDACELLGCSHTNKASGSLCSDGVFCNGLETCNSNGVCVSGTPPCVGNTNACNNTCNEANANCYTPIGTSCDDGLFCTQTDTCNGQGRCVGGTKTPCDGQSACNSTCNETAKNCFSNTSTVCDDGLFCNGPDRCNGTGGCGIHLGNPCANMTADCMTTNCTEQARCYSPINTTCTADAGDPYGCTTDVCNGNGTCTHQMKSSCDDGNPCTSNTHCVNTGTNYTCVGDYICACTGPQQCDDQNPCTTDTCDAGTCNHTPVANLTLCEDWNWCNGLDYCMGGVCTPSNVSPCGTDQCNSTCNGVNRTCEAPMNTPCSDGQWCTVGDVCNGLGACVGGLLTPCSGNPVCNNTCNETLHTCFSPSGTNCNNTIYCDGAETCDGSGQCNSSGNPCANGVACRRACDESTQQCVFNANGVFCQGDRCQGDWFCIDGTCTATLVSPCNSTQCCNSNTSLPLCYSDATCPAPSITPSPSPVMASSHKKIPMLYYYIAGAGAFLLLCLLLSIILVVVIRKRSSKNKLYKPESQQSFVHNNSQGASDREKDNELAMGTIGAFYASTGQFPVGSHKSLKFVEECKVDNVDMGRMVGSGNFGKVYQGVWNVSGGTRPVALKTLKDREFFEEFISEAAILKQFDHINVVKFYGIFVRDGVNYIVTEFMNRGSLLDVLQTVNLSLDELKEMALGAARGMEYLSSKNIIHRDLACRNLLVSYENGHYIVKVSDFGMSRNSDSYYYSESNRIPVKWSPPEVLRHRKYTPQSDVWSYGVSLWEMYSGGVEPYTAMSNAETVEAVISGYRMSAPSVCPPSIYRIMQLCWTEDFHKRPSFTEIVQMVENSSTNLPSMYENINTTLPPPIDDDLPPPIDDLPPPIDDEPPSYHAYDSVETEHSSTYGNL